VAVVTEVIGKLTRTWTILGLLAALTATAFAQQEQQLPASSTNVTIPKEERPAHDAEHLYLQLRGNGLDAKRVYKIREASLDRDQLHITLEDGTIAFTTDVLGRVTGAFFEGTGEVLVIPPNEGERASMMLFTKAAVLEEAISSAYFRFNDDTFSDLQPNLRPPEDGEEFARRWNSAALNLAEWDALRLFMTFSCYLPPSDAGPRVCAAGGADRFLHARVQGPKLGAFDVYYDSTAAEQIVVAQQKSMDGTNYYNVWTSFPSAPSLARSPQLEKPDEVALRSFRIRAEVSPPTTLKAEARVQVEVTRGGMRALLFELSRYLKVSEVKMGSQSLELIQNQALEGTALARRGNDILAVVFPRLLQTGEKFELNFSYGGEVLSEAGGGLLYVGARGTWYPNRGFAAADFDMQFRYPSGWTLLATGKRADPESNVGQGAEPAQEQVSRWQTDRPIPVAGFNLGKYVKASSAAGATSVETYAAAGVERNFPKANEAIVLPQIPTAIPREPKVAVVPQPPPTPARHAQSVADDAAGAVKFYSANFGPFPYGTLKLTQMPGPLSQGWPGLIFLSSYAFLTDEEKSHLHLDEATALLDDYVTAHETAHQWWGDLVFWRGYRDQWIFEGLASYCSLMMLERENATGFRLVLEKYRSELETKNKSGSMLKDAGPVTAGVRLSSSEFPEGYEAISYGRGTWLFHMLRYMLKYGELADAHNGKVSSLSESSAVEPFVRGLRKLRDRYSGKPITTRELIAVFEEELPSSLRYENKKSLQWFYDGWVNGTAMPRIGIKSLKIMAKGTGLQVAGTIEQKDAAKDLVTAVPLYGITANGGKRFLGIVFADGAENSFRIVAPAGIKRVVSDPDQTLLTRSR
jgi:peptidase M1-like protein